MPLVKQAKTLEHPRASTKSNNHGQVRPKLYQNLWLLANAQFVSDALGRNYAFIPLKGHSHLCDRADLDASFCQF